LTTDQEVIGLNPIEVTDFQNVTAGWLFQKAGFFLLFPFVLRHILAAWLKIGSFVMIPFDFRINQLCWILTEGFVITGIRNRILALLRLEE
jgi:hypothetical protein